MQLRQASMAGLVAAAIICTATLAGCRVGEQQDPATENSQVPKRSLPPLPIVEPPFDRGRLLLAVMRAASAHSVGADDLAAQRKLDGKQFEVRLRFGCDGQGPAREGHGWSIDPDGKTLRLRIVPTLSLKDPIAASVSGPEVEAVEGVWLPRPWLLEAACLPEPAETAPDGQGDAAEESRDGEGPSLSGPPRTVQRIGIARFYSQEDSRIGRRIDRPFDAVVTLKEGETAGEAGFNLVLSGRLRALADGRVLRCAGSGRSQPPDCIVSADIDRAWIERPADRKVMAEWTI